MFISNHRQKRLTSANSWSTMLKSRTKHRLMAAFFIIIERLIKDGPIQYYGEIPTDVELHNIIYDNDAVNSIGIILQGPIDYKNDFTLETLRLYRMQYPKVNIVLSTWDDEVTDEFRDEATKLHVQILESELPDNQGTGHVNCQICNSYNGSKVFMDNPDIKYLLKTRTDQRIYKTHFLGYLLNTYNVYSRNQHRILFLDSSYIYIPFFICDYLSFGKKEDIINFYDIPYEDGECSLFKENLEENRLLIEKERSFEQYTFEEFNQMKRGELSKELGKLYAPEVFISFSYFKKYLAKDSNYYDEKIYEEYWEYIEKNIIIIDERDLLLYWPKYIYRAYRDINCFFYGHGLNHAKWLDIMLNGIG